ncbi:MAG: hypothetical protein E7G93_07405 [Bacillus paranthracis]|nr:hypothetical protein [Bacillus paranthracis]
MYIENVRKALRSLSTQEQYELANLTKQILIRRGRINESVRPSEIERYMKNFICGKETKMKYLEGFLESMDLLILQGGSKALLGKQITGQGTWRDILLNVTNDVPSEKLMKHVNNEYIIKELKKLFITIVESCVVEDEEKTIQRLHLINEILNKK